MKSIFIFGASVVHGVGGTKGGWADKLKSSLHAQMYGPEGVGEVCDVFELGVPGTTIADIMQQFEPALHARLTKNIPEDTYIIFSAGTNDSKAVDKPQNYYSSVGDFAASVEAFIQVAKAYSTHIIGVGIFPVNEAKTTPLAGTTVYFTNERIQSFDQALRRTCEQERVGFVSTFERVPEKWQTDFLFTDGLHPNNAGHEWLYNRVAAKLRKILGPL